MYAVWATTIKAVFSQHGSNWIKAEIRRDEQHDKWCQQMERCEARASEAEQLTDWLTASTATFKDKVHLGKRDRQTEMNALLSPSGKLPPSEQTNKQSVSFLAQQDWNFKTVWIERKLIKASAVGFTCWETFFLSVPFIIKNHQRSKSNYRQCVNVSHQRTVDLVNEWRLLKMSRCKRNNMGKHSFLVLNIWLMSYMCPTHRSSLASWMA